MAQRLHEALRAVVRLVPHDVADSASAMSRTLDLNRATCQRVLNTVRQPGDSADLLLSVPGIQGMGLFIGAVEAQTPKADVIAGARAAVEQFRSVITRLAGTHANLCRRLRTPKHATVPPVEPLGDGEVDLGTAQEADARERRWLFHVAARIVGRYSEVFSSIQIYRPVPAHASLIDCVSTVGYLGYRARSGAMPLVFKQGRPLSARFATLDQRSLEGATGSLLEGFCTRGRFRVTSAQTVKSDDVNLWQIIDISNDTPDAANNTHIDLVGANRTAVPIPHPARQDPPIEEAWMLVTTPARHLLLDVYMHRDLARMSIQTADVHLWGPNIQQTIGQRWVTRLPGGPAIQLLGIGLERAANPIYPRHAELTHYLFDQVGWDAGDFVGFRCQEEYPIWRAGYRIAMDFTGSPLPEDEPPLAEGD